MPYVYSTSAASPTSCSSNCSTHLSSHSNDYQLCVENYQTWLRGLSSKPETELGWDEENNCFTASDEHWQQLEEANGDYKDFKLSGSCFLYDITPRLRGKK
ncbi:uncharacterized protein [Coffea arabica]|uniref:Uncharacterized protein isoform X2 n=1 Tax=Coffea arabica TaxID=13443 RepID=A0ABM4UXT4_COFAR